MSLRIAGLYFNQNCLADTEIRNTMDSVPYAFRSVGYSHLPILPAPNSFSHHSTHCCSLWGSNWM